MFNPLVGPPLDARTTYAPAGTNRESGVTGAINVGGVSGDARLVVGGTPSRVIAIAAFAGATLYAFRWAGFRFNIGVSS